MISSLFNTFLLLVSLLSAGETHLHDINLKIKDCESYPYYNSQVEQREGNETLRRDLNMALQVGKSCLAQNDFAPFVVEKFKHLYSIVEGRQEKTLTCNYGVTNSYYAVADDENLSVIFDTNRMAGNFPLNLDEDDRRNFVRFYGDRLQLEDVISGTRNPLIGYIEDPMALVFHEIFHWTGSTHHPKKYPDIVYLAQFCCFPQVEHTAQEQAFMCGLLEERAAWQEDELKRLEYLKSHNIQNKIKELIRKYH
ncbi:MAG: hypothetical protein NXH75_05990 [Halobacteriovoraceae bacterium]|nr:hypothetical protein [Halobacteriovoraceae bacterium]